MAYLSFEFITGVSLGGEWSSEFKVLIIDLLILRIVIGYSHPKVN